MLFHQLTPLGICQVLPIQPFSFKEVNKTPNLYLCWPPLSLNLVSGTSHCASSSATRCEVTGRVLVQILVTAPEKVLLKQNKLDPFLVTSQVQHLLLLSIQCQYSQTIVVASTVTSKLSLLSCVPPLLLTTQNEPVFIQTEAFNLKYNPLIDAF